MENNDVTKPEEKKNNSLVILLAIVVVLVFCVLSAQGSNQRAATATATKDARDSEILYGTITCKSCLDDVPVLMWKAPFAIGTDKESDLAGMTYDKDTVRILEEKSAFGQTWYLIRLVPEGDTGWVMEHLIIPD